MKLLTGRHFPLEHCLDEINIVQVNENSAPPQPLGKMQMCGTPALQTEYRICSSPVCVVVFPSCQLAENCSLKNSYLNDWFVFICIKCINKMNIARKMEITLYF